MNDAVSDANTVSNYYRNLAPTQTFNNVTSSLTLNGNGGLNVVRVRSFDYRNGDTLTLNGSGADVFVINVTQNFSFRNSHIVLTGGVAVSSVLFNFTNSNAEVTFENANSVIVGTFLAPRGDVVFRASDNFDGAILGQNVSVLAGATLDNGVVPPPPPGGGTATLSGTIFADNEPDGVQSPDPFFGELGLEGVIVHLTGVDDLGQAVSLSTTTNGDGFFTFTGLRAGTYEIVEEQPQGWVSSPVLPPSGSLGGTMGADMITSIVVGNGDQGTGYNFAELFSGE
jgi:hypothetical protein